VIAQLLRSVAVFALLAAGESCFGHEPAKNDNPAETPFEVGKHYRVVLREIDGNEAITTTYWATVRHVDEKSLTVADGEWTQFTGPVVKPRSQIVLTRISSSIERMMGRKPVVGIARATPMGEEVATFPRSRITQAAPISEKELLERKLAHIASHPRPPHAPVPDAID
jgi:hypothetical protein